MKTVWIQPEENQGGKQNISTLNHEAMWWDPEQIHSNRGAYSEAQNAKGTKSISGLLKQKMETRGVRNDGQDGKQAGLRY